jgi:tetratricopeptide (TPR) repeat protein
LASGLISSCKTSKAKTSSKNTSENVIKKDDTKFAGFFIDGCKERMKGNIEIAENLFKECLKIDPNSAAVKYELGNIYRYKGLKENAIKYAKECATADPKNQWYQMLFIECLQDNGQYMQAADVYQKLIKQFPEKPEFYEGLAAQYMYAGSYEKSFKVYEDLEKKFGYNDVFILNKIKLLKQLKKNSEVELEFKKLISKSPSESRYYTFLAEFYQEINESQKAFDTYKEVLKIDPNNPMVHLAFADYYKQQGDKENFYKEIKIAFTNPELEVETKLKILISYYQLTEQGNEYMLQAAELVDIMLQIHPNSPESHSIHADFLLRDKKTKEARDEYEYAAKLDKSKFAVWSQLMLVDSELNDYEALAKHSEEAKELFPNQPAPYFFNGFANVQLKNYQKAIESLNEGIEFVYNNNALLIQFYSNLGEAHNALKEYEKSDKAFDNALKVDPDNTYILNNYAYYLSLRKEKLEKAEKYARRCSELSPNNRNYLDTYGWVLYQLGKYKEAEVLLSKAAKMGNKSPVIIEHYGDVLFKLGNVEEALIQWKEAKSSGGKSELLEKKIQDKMLHE